MNTVAGHPLLKIENLVVEFYEKKRTRKVIDDISFSINQSECVGLVGESGSGKSTVANAIMHFVPVKSGNILYKGNDITYLKGSQLRELYRDVQMIFQNPEEAMSSRMKIGKYVTEVLRTYEHLDSRTAKAKAVKLLDSMGLPEEYAKRYPVSLSGGEKQRVAIARAVSITPSLLICDEPTSALDVSVQALMVKLLIELQKETGMAYLFISHDLSLIRYICQKVIVMYYGKIMEILNAEQLVEDARHPYTRKLLSAVFTEDAHEEMENQKPEKPVEYLEVSGCSFQNVCPYVMDVCKKEKPKLEMIGKDHYLACFDSNLKRCALK